MYIPLIFINSNQHFIFSLSFFTHHQHITSSTLFLSLP